MTTPRSKEPGVTMVTSRMLGAFRDNPETRKELLMLLSLAAAAVIFVYFCETRFLYVFRSSIIAHCIP